MTQIKIEYSEDGYMNICIKGHANYAPKGKDIVCAGISAIANTAMLGLQSIARTYPGYVSYEEVEVDVQEDNRSTK